MIEYDNRYLWMNLKTLKGCHFANYREAWEANRLDRARARSTRRCRRCSRSTRPARPRTRCTTTCTRASSACSCLAPEEGLGVTDAETARAATSTRSRCSAARLSRRAGIVTMHAHRDRPRRHRRQRPRGRDRLLPATPTACEVEHREVVEKDGVEEALLKVADSYVQLLTPIRDDSPVAKYLEQQGRGPPPRRLPRRRLRRGARAGEGRGPPGDRRGAAARAAGAPRSRSCTRRPRSAR